MDTTSQIGELGNGLHTLTRILRQVREIGGDKVAKSLLVAAPYPTTHLVQVGKTKVLGVVDKDGIGIGHIQAAFYNGRGNQDVVVPVDKGEHHLL